MPKQPVNLSFALNLKPEKALEYFQSKGYIVPEKLSENWQDVWQEAHAKAFTVARATRLDILKDIREELDKALSEGKTFKQFQKELEPRLKAKGWWGYTKDENGKNVQLGSVRRLKTIYDNNMNTAYSAGRFKEMIENSEERPYWQYDSIGDSRTRPAHAALDGKVFRYDDPFWNSHYPPNGFGCRCSVRALSVEDVKDRGFKVDDSKNALKTEMVQVSSKNKELKPVTVYTDPTTGEQTATDIGWNYNVGKAAWQPDLEKYDYKTAKQYTQGVVTGLPFQYFFQKTAKQNINEIKKAPEIMPVAILSKNNKKILGAKSQVVNLSNETLKKQLETHPEIVLSDYHKLPDIIEQAEVITQEGSNKLIFLKDENKYKLAILKATEDKKELYLVTFYNTDLREVQRRLKKGKVIKNELK